MDDEQSAPQAAATACAGEGAELSWSQWDPEPYDGSRKTCLSFHLRHFPGIVLRQLQKAQSYQKAGGNKGLILRMEELLDSRKDSPETLTRGKGI